MLKFKYISHYVLLPMMLTGLVACSGNNSSTTIGAIEQVNIKPVDKTLSATGWTAENYQSFAALGHDSLIENLNLRSAFLGREKQLAVFLTLASTQGTLSCDFGNMIISQDGAHIRAKFNDCQRSGTRYAGEIWTDLSIACNDSVVTDTFIMGYKNYAQRQKLDGSTNYSQIYANGEYRFVSRSQLDLDKITADTPCPKVSGIDSKIILSPQEFIQSEKDGSETTINNASYEIQPKSKYVEFKNLELIEKKSGSLIYSITGLITANGLGSDVAMTGAGFKYAQNGNTTEGTLKLVSGKSEISLRFSPDSVTVSLDLDTQVDGIDATEVIAQSDF